MHAEPGKSGEYIGYCIELGNASKFVEGRLVWPSGSVIVFSFTVIRGRHRLQLAFRAEQHAPIFKRQLSIVRMLVHVRYARLSVSPSRA